MLPLSLRSSFREPLYSSRIYGSLSPYYHTSLEIENAYLRDEIVHGPLALHSPLYSRRSPLSPLYPSFPLERHFPIQVFILTPSGRIRDKIIFAINSYETVDTVYLDVVREAERLGSGRRPLEVLVCFSGGVRERLRMLRDVRELRDAVEIEVLVD